MISVPPSLMSALRSGRSTIMCPIEVASLDSIRFSTDQKIDLLRIRSEYSGKVKYHGGTAHYELNYSFPLLGGPECPEGTSLSILHGPRRNANAPALYSVTVQPGDYASWNGFMLHMMKLFPGFDWEEPRINALHAFCDVPLPVSFFREHLRIARKRSEEVYQSNSDTIVVGKTPIRTQIYNRMKVLGKEGTLTRVEVQYSGQKCPIRKFSNVNDLKDCNPFRYFSFLAINPNAKDKVVLHGLRRAIDMYGMFTTIRRVMGSGRVQRYVKNGTLLVLKEPNLSEDFVSKNHKFIGENPLTGLQGQL